MSERHVLEPLEPRLLLSAVTDAMLLKLGDPLTTAIPAVTGAASPQIVAGPDLADGAQSGGQAATVWRIMPIRSEQEYNLGLLGGEGEQWIQGMARSVSNPDVIYLSHDVGQVWRSDDNGLTWRKLLCHGMNTIAGQSIEVDPVHADVVFAVMDDSYNYYVENYQGLYRSTDGGENWTLVLHPTHDPMVQRFYQHCIAYDPASVTGSGAARWYAAFPASSTGTSGTGACLYRSENYGVTWTKVRNNLTSELGIQTIYEIRTHPTDGNTLYMCTEDGLFVSHDRGVTLTLVSGGGMPANKAVRSLIVHPTTPTTLYAAVYLDGLYCSTNGGATWTELYDYNYTIRAFMNPAYPNVMYVMPNSTAGRNLMVTTNGGSSWTKINYTVPAPGLGREWKLTIRGDFCAVLPDPRSPTAAVAQGSSCFFRTTDGINWVDSSTLFTGYAASWCQNSFEFGQLDPDQITLYCCDVGMIYTDNGADWFARSSVRSLYDAGLISWSGMHSGDTQPIEGSQVIVASAGMYWTLKLIRTTDGGATWSVVNDTVQNYFFIQFHPDDPNLVFAGDQKSTDAGATWTTIPYLSSRSAAIFGMCQAHPDTLYAIDGDRNEILRSDDRGVTWRSYTGQVSWRFYGMDSKPTFICDPVNPNIVYAKGSTGDLARFDGTRWTNLGVLPLAGGSAFRNYVRTVAIDPRHPEIIYAGMHSAGLESLWRSTDGGATWQSISYNLPQAGASALAVNPHTGDLFYGSCFGTWVLAAPYDDPDSIYDKLFCPVPLADAGEDQTVEDTDGNGSQAVTLNGSASWGGYGQIVSYVWAKDGSTIATGATPQVTLPVGVHTLTLTVTNDALLPETAVDTVVVEITAMPQPPIASAGPDQVVVDADRSGSESVLLDGSASHDLDGQIVGWVWSLGGAPIATGATPQVSLPVGRHTLTLEVTDNDGLTDTDTVTVIVQAPPVADAGPDQDVQDSDHNGSEPVTLDGSGSYDLDGYLVSWVWYQGTNQIATGASPQVTLAVGAHTLTLEVADDDGLIGTDQVVVTVTAPLIGDFNGNDQLDDGDIDLLSAAMRQGLYLPEMDLDDSGAVDAEDHRIWVYDCYKTVYGDATLDRQVTLADLGVVGTYWGQTGQGWAHGDYNGDGQVTLADLGLVGTNWGWGTEGSSASQPADGGAPPKDDPAPQARSLLLADSSPIASQQTWQNFAIPEQTGAFSVEFDATPDAGNIDGVVGFLDGQADWWTDLACIFRFNTAGQMDVRNGGAYMADVAAPYAAGVTYHVRMRIDVPSHTYSVWVTPAGGTEIALASDYAFRTEQAAVTRLDHWALLHWDTAGFTVANMVVGAGLTADAGPDQTVLDEDEDGQQLVALDGTGSADADGTIVGYTWKEGEAVLATGPTPSVVLARGVHTITLIVTDNDGNTADDTVVITVRAPVAGNVFHVDPLHGSMANDGSYDHPWRTLAEVFASGLIESRNKDGVVINPGAPVKAGDTILLRSGYHGDPSLSGYHNDELITVAAEEGNTPALRRLTITGCRNWTFQGLSISTELSPSFAFVGSLVSVNSNSTHGTSSFVTIDGCFVYSVLDTTGYSAADWVNRTSNGISLGLDGHHLAATNNRLLNVDHGIAISSTESYVAYNEIVNFRGDGIRALNHNQTVEYNLIKNCYDVDDNHDDGIQVFKANVSQGLITNMVLRGNTIINFEDINQPHRGTLQGIGIFEGPHENFLIENNVVITNHWHGITLYWGLGCTIVNNTVFNPLYVTGQSSMSTWIQIGAAKSAYGGEYSTNCAIRNNIAHRFQTSGNVNLSYSNNLVVTSSNYAACFVDALNRDLHLRPGSPAIDAGTAVGAPTVDIEGHVRPLGAAWDIGAYEYVPPVVGDFNGDGLVNAVDIDLLSVRMRQGTYDARMDFDADGDVDASDHGHLIRNVIGTQYGDATLDKRVTLADLGVLGTNWGLSNRGWSHGDFNGDGLVTLADLGFVGTYWGWVAPAEGATAGEAAAGRGDEAGGRQAEVDVQLADVLTLPDLEALAGPAGRRVVS